MFRKQHSCGWKASQAFSWTFQASWASLRFLSLKLLKVSPFFVSLKRWVLAKADGFISQRMRFSLRFLSVSLASSYENCIFETSIISVIPLLSGSAPQTNKKMAFTLLRRQPGESHSKLSVSCCSTNAHTAGIRKQVSILRTKVS